MKVAEIWRCAACPWTYEATVALSAPPLHPCPTPHSSNRKPATKKETPT